MERRMDRELADALNKLWSQNDVLKRAEEQYLEMEANKKSLLAQLTLTAEGKSFAEREAKALASADWKQYSMGLVAAESRFNYEKRKFDILDKAFYAAHSSYKLDERSIRRPGA